VKEGGEVNEAEGHLQLILLMMLESEPVNDNVRKQKMVQSLTMELGGVGEDEIPEDRPDHELIHWIISVFLKFPYQPV
jgi:hypothetical protein